MKANPRQCILVLVTCPSLPVARRLGTAVVTRRLAACVNLVPRVESVFWWNGKIDRCREVLLLIKTRRARFERLRRAVVSIHPYDVPEVIALPLIAGHRPYLRWLSSCM